MQYILCVKNAEIKKRALFTPCKVVKTKAGSDVGVLGAAALVIKNIKKK